MLGKLIKNDFKASAHSMLGIYLVAFAVFAATAVAYKTDENSATTIQGILTAVLIFVSFAILIIPIFQILTYFNKSLYKNSVLWYYLTVKGSSYRGFSVQRRQYDNLVIRLCIKQQDFYCIFVR